VDVPFAFVATTDWTTFSTYFAVCTNGTVVPVTVPPDICMPDIVCDVDVVCDELVVIGVGL